MSVFEIYNHQMSRLCLLQIQTQLFQTAILLEETLFSLITMEIQKRKSISLNASITSNQLDWQSFNIRIEEGKMFTSKVFDGAHLDNVIFVSGKKL